MPSRPPLQLGVWQATAPATPSGGITDAVQSITQALTQAKEAGVEVLIFPECFLTGYFRPAEEIVKVASQVDASLLEQLAGFATETDIAFVLGSYALATDAPATEAPTTDAPQAVTNTAYVFLPDAQKPLAYHKRTLFGDWEKSVFQRGSKPLLFDYRDYTFAVLICYDIEFPELTREVAQLGADALLVPTALMEPEHWIADFFIPTRAIESGVTIAYANYTGKSQDLTFIGKSQIYNPSAQRKTIAPPNHQGLITANLEDLNPHTHYLAEIKTQNIKPL